MDRIPAPLLTASIWCAAMTGQIEAACNVIPDPKMLTVDTPVAAIPGTSDRKRPEFGFKGALGRIDQIYVVPDRTSSLTVVPDGICVAPDSGPIAPSKIDPAKDVALIYFLSPDRTGSRVIAYAPDCARLRAELDHTLELLSCSEGAKLDRESTALKLPLTWSELPALRNSEASYPLRVVVVQAAEGALSDLSLRAGKSPCREQCKTLGRTGGLLACVDELFAPVNVRAPQAQFAFAPVPCELGVLPAANVFAKACENEDATPPQCQPTSPRPELRMWHDKCGGVHIPISWEGILEKDANGALKPRRATGFTGVGRAKSDQDPLIRVPGREFMGSTRLADPGGTGVNWRKPDLHPTYRATHKEEFGIAGTVDQIDSVIHVFPRLSTKKVCVDDPARACLKIGPVDDGSYIDCACTDSFEDGCTCTDLSTERYFACDAGKYQGLPCMRDQHCNPDGKCKAKPRCQKPGEPWKGPDNSGQECTVDSECTTGGKTQCGFSLFNLENAIENPMPSPPPFLATGTIVLDATITSANPRKRRGACKNSKAACGNGSGPHACPASDECDGYLFGAGGPPP